MHYLEKETCTRKNISSQNDIASTMLSVEKLCSSFHDKNANSGKKEETLFESLEKLKWNLEENI